MLYDSEQFDFYLCGRKATCYAGRKQLNLTQSATSAAIAALETRYGIKLFDRIGRGIVLTPAGRDS